MCPILCRSVASRIHNWQLKGGWITNHNTDHLPEKNHIQVHSSLKKLIVYSISFPGAFPESWFWLFNKEPTVITFANWTNLPVRTYYQVLQSIVWSSTPLSRCPCIFPIVVVACRCCETSSSISAPPSNRHSSPKPFLLTFLKVRTGCTSLPCCVCIFGRIDFLTRDQLTLSMVSKLLKYV